MLAGIESNVRVVLSGLLLAACFLFISRSRPLKFLAKQRPMPNIFNAYTLLTVTLQFAVHFGCMIFIVQQAHAIEPRQVESWKLHYNACALNRKEKIDLESEFKPNLLNSAVYVMSMALQVSTFAVNYRVINLLTLFHDQ